MKNKQDSATTNFFKTVSATTLLITLPFISGCWAAAGAVGAEAAYVGTQEHRTAGETIDDQLILSSIKTKLITDPIVSGFSIDVDVYRGVVQLRGYVKSEAEIARAIELANNTSGVHHVESRLVLDPQKR